MKLEAKPILIGVGVFIAARILTGMVAKSPAGAAFAATLLGVGAWYVTDKKLLSLPTPVKAGVAANAAVGILNAI